MGLPSPLRGVKATGLPPGLLKGEELLLLCLLLLWLLLGLGLRARTTLWRPTLTGEGDDASTASVGIWVSLCCWLGDALLFCGLRGEGPVPGLELSLGGACACFRPLLRMPSRSGVAEAPLSSEVGSSKAARVELLLLWNFSLSMPHSAWKTERVFCRPSDCKKSATTLSLAIPRSEINWEESVMMWLVVCVRERERA